MRRAGKKTGHFRCKEKKGGQEFSTVRIYQVYNNYTFHELYRHRNTHSHTHKQMGLRTGLQGVPSITERELSMPALFLPVPSLVAARFIRPITTGTVRLCTDLQIICCFTIAPKTRQECYIYIYFSLSAFSCCYPPISDECPVL